MCQLPPECDTSDVTAFASPPSLLPPYFSLVILESTSHDRLYVSSTIFTALVSPVRNHAAPAHLLTASVWEVCLQNKQSCLLRRVEGRCSCCQRGNMESHFRTLVHNLHQLLDESLVCEGSDIM